jgi:murein L,D-transpeptidase YafK
MKSILVASLLSLLMTSQSFGFSTPETTTDRIVILKKERTLQLLSNGKVFKSYKVALGGNPIGGKEREGDGKTPEGNYVIDYRNPHSSFHRALHVSYPNEADKARAKALGVSPGSLIMIHGFGWIGSAHRLHDWTNGCIAVTNDEIDEIWKLVPDGTPVEIRP